MKTMIILLGMLSFTMFYAQQDTSGKVGINTITPTETLDIKGTAKIQELPKNGEGKIYNGSSSKNTIFNATRSVVTDDNGVLGYIDINNKNTRWLGNNAVCTQTEIGDAIVVAGGKYVCVDVSFKGTKYPSWVYEGVIYKHMTEPIVGTVYTMVPLISMQRKQGGVEFKKVEIKASVQGDQTDNALVVNREGDRSPFFSIRTRAIKDNDFPMRPGSMLVGSETEMRYTQQKMNKDATTLYYISNDYIQEGWLGDNPMRGPRVYNSYLTLIENGTSTVINTYGNKSTWSAACLKDSGITGYTGRDVINKKGGFFNGNDDNLHCWDLNYKYPFTHDEYYGYANSYSAFLSMDYLPTTVIHEIPAKK